MSLLKVEENWKWVAIKTNKNGKWISFFEENEESVNLSKRLQLFSKWIGNVTEYQMVAYGHELYHSFFSEIERFHSNVFSRHLVRMLKAQLWNIKSECMYRFQIKEQVSIEELLFFYQQDPIYHPNEMMKECVNLLTLANLFLFDKGQTKKLMKKSKEEAIVNAYQSYTTEELILKLTEDGQSIKILPSSKTEIKLSKQQNQEKTLFYVGDNLHSALVRMAVDSHPLTFK